MTPDTVYWAEDALTLGIRRGRCVGGSRVGHLLLEDDPEPDPPLRDPEVVPNALVRAAAAARIAADRVWVLVEDHHGRSRYVTRPRATLCWTWAEAVERAETLRAEALLDLEREARRLRSLRFSDGIGSARWHPGGSEGRTDARQIEGATAIHGDGPRRPDGPQGRVAAGGEGRQDDRREIGE